MLSKPLDAQLVSKCAKIDAFATTFLSILPNLTNLNYILGKKNSLLTFKHY